MGESLVRSLGTRDINNFDPGTRPEELIQGMPKFLEKFSKKLKFWDWRGWGANQVESGSPAKAASFNWIGKHLKKAHREVLLHIGMYKKTADHHFKRMFGHFVTCVGFKKKTLELKLNDPSPRVNKGNDSEPRTEILVKTESMKNDTLEADGKEISAYGYEKLNNLDLVPGADIAVIDGAYVFETA